MMDLAAGHVHETQRALNIPQLRNIPLNPTKDPEYNFKVYSLIKAVVSSLGMVCPLNFFAECVGTTRQ